MTDTHSGLHPVENGHVELSELQQAWLSEVGLDRRILARYRRVETSVISPPRVQPEAGVPKTGQVSRQDARPESTPSDRPHADLARMALKQARTPRASHTKPSIRGGLHAVGVHLEMTGAPRLEDLPTDWTALGAHASACQACGLQTQRDQLVFGTGDMDHPDWLIVGEAPGKADDRTGLPFQGKAGKLLHAMLIAAGVHPASHALGSESQGIPPWSQPASMYFANLIKCRPLGNRSPTPSEIASCIPYLTQQIELLQPRRILALGRLAAQALLQVDADIEDLRGQVHHMTTASGRTIPLVVTWHPAALLMHPQNKGQAWTDLNLAKHLGG